MIGGILGIRNAGSIRKSYEYGEKHDRRQTTRQIGGVVLGELGGHDSRTRHRPRQREIMPPVRVHSV
jgi:hypothetical protein